MDTQGMSKDDATCAALITSALTRCGKRAPQVPDDQDAATTKPLTSRQKRKIQQERDAAEKQRLLLLRDRILALLKDEGVDLGFYRTGDYEDCSGFITLESKGMEQVYVSLEPEIADD